MGDGTVMSDAERVERARARMGRVARTAAPGFALAAIYALFFLWLGSRYTEVGPLDFLQYWLVFCAPCVVLAKLRSLRSSSTWFLGGQAGLILSALKIGLLIAAPALVMLPVISACRELDAVARPLGTVLLLAFEGAPVAVVVYLAAEGLRAAYLAVRPRRG